jgi:acyl-coenzyme A synthetase/AMP-(fatty) acid ligase
MYSGATFSATENKLMYYELPQYLLTRQATCFGGSPIQLRWITEWCMTQQPIPLRLLMSSGDNLSISIIADINQYMPNTEIHVMYGLTEVGGRLSILHPNELNERKGSVGKPIGKLKLQIIDEEGILCAPQKPGNICVSGDYLFSGYLNDKSPLEPFGFNTGDVGYLDADGYLYLLGRSDQVFKCAGKKVSTFPINNALRSIDAFQDSIAVPIAHDMLGHVPCVVYSLKKNAIFNKGNALSILRKILPANHLPRNFIEVAHIPRTGSGKPKYKQIASLINTNE